MDNLICYKEFPIWTKDTLPQMFQEKHNTKAGTWAKLKINKGKLKFIELSEDNNILSENIFDANNQPYLVEPQIWHRVEAITDDLECQLSFWCKSESYYAKKYNLTETHSEVQNLINYIKEGSVLDLGSGRGRNSLYLNLLDFDVTAVDYNNESINFLNTIIEKENLKNIKTNIYDINQANIHGQFDLIISTVVMMFLDKNKIPEIIQNMQDNTKTGGYNLIVCAMDTKDYPCPVPFSFTFKEKELAHYYQDWELIKYNENLGELHKTDINGNRIKMRFVTMLAKKFIKLILKNELNLLIRFNSFL